MSSQKGTSKINILAVTACTTGVAHTYMAAEILEKLARKYDFNIKIETQGVLGIKNKLLESDIAQTDLVIVAADIVIDEPARFSGCRVINVKIGSLLMDSSSLLVNIKKILHYSKGKTLDILPVMRFYSIKPHLHQEHHQLRHCRFIICKLSA